MIILNENNVYIAQADEIISHEIAGIGTVNYYHDKENNIMYQIQNYGLSHTDIPLPNEQWALPKQAKLVDGVWVKNPDYVAPEEIIG